VRIFFVHIVLCFIVSVGVSAQTETDQQLAAQYFKNSEYDKAAVLYERMYRKTRDEFFYRYYVDCLIKLEDFSEAEKVVSKRLKKEKSGQLLVQLGNIFKQSGQDKKAKQQFDLAIKELEPSKVIIEEISTQFQAIGEPNMAIATMKKGRKLLSGAYGFGYELADLYQRQGSFDKELEEYFGILSFNPNESAKVQSVLLQSLENDDSGQKHEFFMQELIAKIQSAANSDVFAELLIWHHLQRKEFDSAYTQAKALDRRNKEDGARIIEIAQVASTNFDYDLAVNAYKYVLKKGSDNYFYYTAKMDMVQTMYKKITQSGNFTDSDLAELETSYLSTLEELGRNANSVKLLRGLAELYVF
jgi:tetratricopeptide (TPR) repeat protein